MTRAIQVSARRGGKSEDTRRAAFVSGFCVACVELGKWHGDLAAALLRDAGLNTEDAKAAGMDSGDVQFIEKILTEN